ncbi:hypothetical protein NB636_01030 [Oxalobacter aliiformigenes]|uniref:PIN-like domain-containing protein n=1 Tax=Oxalobacter aliiformigenes TaxID=2946593 RepID=UPI0022AF5EB2|nr:DUF5615 family PIN-like protein [Oxalobacter aliiformigenes]MCZ4064097.1 hypothetical protein [Oxalobacter aliiformigenes]WAV99474.1 hypothetical protein NB636_01030 [Oxalobacter aliiformigenes]
MKFVFDNNIAPSIAKAIKELSKTKYDNQHNIIHLRDEFAANTKDDEWIKSLSIQRDTCVITKDRLDKGMEADLLSQSGLIVFHLDSSWNNKGYGFWDEAVNLIRWWPRIVQQAEGITGGAAFKVKWKFTGIGKFEQVRRR